MTVVITTKESESLYIVGDMERCVHVHRLENGQWQVAKRGNAIFLNLDQALGFATKKIFSMKR